jgi:mono/diheme cytochrome c family protein
MREAERYLPKLSRALLLGAAMSCTPLAAHAGGAIDKQDFGQIEKGRYLTVVGDCAACHSLPGSGHDFAGGRPIETPFGNLVAPNITPDPVTGIGAWTDDEFVDALTKGTGRDGTLLYPAMPYTYYTKLRRDDALAIRAYLNTVPAGHNAVTVNHLPFPLDIRAGMTAWNALFFTPGAFEPDSSKSAAWNRGAYLVEGLGHCGLCHTPKNALGADETGERMQGYALQGWFAPNITNDPRVGLGSWSVDDIATYLKTGHNATAAGTGLMAETLNLSTSKMSDPDLEAIATYLKDQPGDASNKPDQPQGAPPAPDQSVMKAGAQIYADECSGCHTGSGKGIPGLFPAVAGAPIVQQSDPTSLVHVILRGALSVGTKPAPTAAAMPAFAWVLNDDEIATVVTYIRDAWGNRAPAVSAGDVRKERDLLAKRSD